MSGVSAVIATRNRHPELVTCLENLAAQSRPPDEIVVVDDHSSDSTPAIAAQFPTVRYIRLPKQRGYIHARNLGIENSSGKYVVSLDDDSWFLSAGALHLALIYAEANPDIAVLAFNIVDPAGRTLFPPQAPYAATRSFVGCGHLLRRDAVLAAGKYTEEFGHMGEEKDLSLRLYDRGYRVVSAPDILVHHAQSSVNRDWQRIRFCEHRNDVLRELIRCPLALLPVRLPWVWLAHSRYNFQHRYWTTDLRVLAAMPKVLFAAARIRRPVAVSTYRKWIQLPC